MASLHDTVHVKGLADVGAKLEKLELGFKEKVARAAVQKAAQVGLTSVQTEVPIRTGNLFHHLTIGRRTRGVANTVIQYVLFVKTLSRRRNQGKGKKTQGTSAQSRPDPYYWFFVEFGTSRMAANPFLLRGFVKSAENAATQARDIAAFKLRDVV